MRGPGRLPLCGGAASYGTELVPPAPTNPPQSTAEPQSQWQGLGNSRDKGGKNGEGNSERDSPESPKRRERGGTEGSPGVPAGILWEPLEKSMEKKVVPLLPMKDWTQDPGDKSLWNCMERLPWSRFILKDSSLWSEDLKVPSWNKGKHEKDEKVERNTYGLTTTSHSPSHCTAQGGEVDEFRSWHWAWEKEE